MNYSFLRKAVLLGFLAGGLSDVSKAAQVQGEKPLEGVSTQRALLATAPSSDRSQAVDLLLEGEELLEVGKAEEALERFTRGLFLRPNDALLHYARGQALRVLGKEEQAKLAFRKAVESDPSDEVLRKRVIRRLGYEKGDDFPVGSLVLFEDVPCLGCRQHLKPETVGVDLDFKTPFRGVSTLVLTPPKDVAWEFSLSLNGAFVAAGLKRLGDIYSLRDKGALIMFIRLENDEDRLEIGFRGRKVSWSKNPVEVSLPLEAYLSPGKLFQYVVIPLSDFSEKGYIQQIRKTHPYAGDTPKKTDLTDPKAVPFHWDRVADIFLRGSEGSHEGRKVSLDRWAIVPNYSAARAEQAIAKAREGWAKRLKSRGFRLFGDRPVGGTYAVPRSEVFMTIDETIYHKGRASIRAEFDTNIWSVVGFRFPEKNLGPIKRSGFLKFFVRGENGGERFITVLHSRPNGTQRVVTEGPDVRSFVDISLDWKEVAIPLAYFPGNGFTWHESYAFANPAVFGWNRVTEVSFESAPTDEISNIFYLDEVRFSQ